MRHQPENRDLELALRRSLYERAGHAPAAGPLAERIVATAERSIVEFAPPRRSHAWRTWALPLLAAGAAAAVVGAVAVVQNHKPEAKVPPIASPTSTAVTSPPASPTGAATSTPVTPTPAPSGTSGAPARAGSLSNVQLLDITFDGTDDGWALAASDCLRTAGRCTALLRTTDGARWTSVASTPFNVPGVNGCAAPCVSHLRFATARIGYAFGPQAFFLTTDGARTWQRQSGGAEALETLDGNVIRVVSDGDGCPGPCHVRVQLAALGATTWTTVHVVPGDLDVAGLAFSRGGSAAYLLAERNPAGGANNATSTLYASTDDGATWQAEGEPCPQPGNGESDSVDVAAASGTRLTVLCTRRGVAEPASFVATSTDGGRTSVATRGSLPVPVRSLAGDPRTVLAAGGDNGLAVSRDGGATWTRIPNVTGSITFVGFESATVGRVVADGGRSLWTTRDGGLTWARAVLR